MNCGMCGSRSRLFTCKAPRTLGRRRWQLRNRRLDNIHTHTHTVRSWCKICLLVHGQLAHPVQPPNKTLITGPFFALQPKVDVSYF